MRRYTLLFLSLLIVLSMVITACQPAVEEPEVDEPAVEEPEDDDVEVEEPEELADQDVVEIEFWQHDSGPRITAMEAIIDAFEAENPNIKVIHNTFPYAEYQTKIAASVPAGTGPDVAMIYFGWAPFWSKSGFIVPLPDVVQEVLDTEFVSFVEATRLDGEHYAIPTSVRNFALFYNVDLLAEAGWDSPPNTWEEFTQAAIDCTKYDNGGNITQAGYYLEWAADGWNWWRPLIQSFGGQPFSEDNKTVLWDSEEAIEAFKYMTDLTLVHKTSTPGFYEGEGSAFAAGLSCMTPQLTYFVGYIRDNVAPDVNYAVTVMPEGPAGRFSTGSAWPVSLTSKGASDPARLEAATKFLLFNASETGVKIFSDTMGELPSRTSMVNLPEYAEDPIFSAFIAQLDQTDGTFWADELAERQCALDMYDSVIVAGASHEDAAAQATACAQAIRDEFFSD
jgi:multiple sugar transport system substrate-binding protein